MTAVTVSTAERMAPAPSADTTTSDMTRGGIASSAILHLCVLALVVVGLPSLFHHPPAEEQPIAVDLVMIAPETKATHPNPYRPRPDAKPEPPIAAPAPKPEPKPEPPPPVPEPPAASAAPAPPPPPEPPKPEAKAPPAPPPPPPKPVEAQAPPLPPPVPRPPEPKPKPEIRQAHHEPRPAPQAKADPAAFDNLLKNLEHQRPTVDKPPRKVEPRRQEQAFDALLQNLTPEQAAEAEDAPPRPHRVAATAPPSSQPKAPLGSQLTASDKDLVNERLRPCFNPPFGAKEKPDLVADIKLVMNRDGTVQQARVADTGQYNSDPIYRAVADAAIRALRNERCSPLPLPPDRFDLWQSFTYGFSIRDMQ